jgi:DNA processing protein
MSCSKWILYSASDIKISQLKELNVEDTLLSDADRNMYEKAQKRCQDHSVFVSTQDDSDHHFKFSLIYSSPYVVYALWNRELLHSNILAIVWPRKYSPYATQVMEALFSSLVNYDLVTISWLADGVDKMCHELSIKNHIPTIAILWWWLKYYLESKDRELIQKIVANGGLVLSEFKLNSRPERYTFPQRNRIVAGLSDMVFLPEASEKSGSLITVDFARQMHKDVYGVPNTMFSSTSQWLHQYMQQWLVIPVVNWEWMLGKYFWKKISNEKLAINNWEKDNLFHAEFSPLVNILQKNPSWLSLNEMVSQIGLGIEEVMSHLSMAEVMGQIRNDGGVWKVK